MGTKVTMDHPTEVHCTANEITKGRGALLKVLGVTAGIAAHIGLGAIFGAVGASVIGLPPELGAFFGAFAYGLKGIESSFEWAGGPDQPSTPAATAQQPPPVPALTK